VFSVDKHNKINRLVRSSFKGIYIILKHEPKMFLRGVFFATLHGLSWGLQIVFAQRFFDVIGGLAFYEVPLMDILMALLKMVLAYSFVQIMNGVDSCHAIVLNSTMIRHTHSLVFERVKKLSGINFESSKRLDEIDKALRGSENLLSVTLTLTDIIFFYVTYFLFMSWYLFTLKPILSLSILIIFIPSLISYIVQISSFRKLEDKSAPLRRECDYYELCIADLKEPRLLGATKFFQRLYFDSLIKINQLVLKVVLRKNAITLILDIITTIGYGVIIYMIVVAVLNQSISVGAFAAVIMSISALFNFMSEVISERIGWAFENVGTVGNFLDFINEEEEVAKSRFIVENEDIIFKNVNFRYPEAKEYALNQINLTLKKGQTIAIVGENGSGKTTLCKLILGLYEPTTGEIYDTNKIELNDSLVQYSAIFQDYNRYKFSVKDNISISCSNYLTIDNEIEKLCEQAGLSLDSEHFSDGIHTMLGRDFDGIELSGGQWQRLAIARGLFRASDSIILDEPTSAIDPLEETRFYHSFMEICQERTALIVTHRLGSIKIVDRIIVLKKGSLIEDGTHDELMALNGEYRRLFESQSKWYT